MKALKKLIPAVALMMVTLVLLGTSTYAWFSMNKTVTATGMTVTAKSNAQYLLIGTSKSIANTKPTTTSAAAQLQTSGNSYMTSTSGESTTYYVYPAAFYTGDSALTVGTGSTITVNKNGWYTANSTSSSDADKDVTNPNSVAEGAAQYMLTYKTWLTLSADSEDYTGTITVGFGLDEGNDEAVSAVVKLENENETEYLSLSKITSQPNNSSTNYNNSSATTAKSYTITSSTALEVTIYIYVDGNSTNVYSDYINGDGTTEGKAITGNVTLTFTIK